MRCLQETMDDICDEHRSHNRAQLLDFERRLHNINADIQMQFKGVDQSDIEPVQTEYEELSALVDLRLSELKRVRNVDSDEEAENRAPRSNPRLGPSERRSVPPTNTGAIPKKRKNKKKKKNTNHDPLLAALNNPANFDDYGTDNEEPMVASVMSACNPGPNFEPMRFPRQGPSHPLNRSVPPQPDRQDRSWGRSYEAYVPSTQACLRGPVDRVALPPRMSQAPYKIRRWDKSLIGISEIFFTTERHNHCCYCKGNHGLFNCNAFKTRENLENRWQYVLMKGLCLSCFLTGHSSFTCRFSRTCRECGQRHNSVLCPRIYERNHQ